MRHSWVAAAVLGACGVTAQGSTSSTSAASTAASSSTSPSSTDPSSSTSSRGTVVQLSFSSISGSTLSGSVPPPTGSYITVTGQTTAPTTLATGNSSISSTSSSDPYRIVGATPTVINGTASTTTTSSATATNTQPCNNYPEFCTRKYSNITEVAAHNAAFDRANNAFSNQLYGITAQLNDGIRMIEGEVHYENGTLYNCHSSCNFLNTGTFDSLLVTTREWIEANPYNVVTILIANSDFADVTVYQSPFENSGILPYVYLPPKSPMFLSDWPTLGEMILSNKRIVVFMDYMANTTAVPYILDQYTQMWETTFSPTDPAFPCTQQRPPNLSDESARNDLMYIANHNLNLQISLLGEDILIPNFAELNTVNAANSSTSSLQTMAENCDGLWNRPPNFLIVDFYEQGNFPGSVFAVAAQMNNVTYDRSCCGKETGVNAAFIGRKISNWAIGAAIVAPVVLGLL